MKNTYDFSEKHVRVSENMMMFYITDIHVYIT